MPRPIRDSVVVITGASSGIGRAAAHEFAKQGATVVLAARREQALEDAGRECGELGGRAMVVPLDVTNEEAVRDLARRTVETFGRIDIWVNNAAVSLFSRFEETPLDLYRKVIETNLFGYIHGARAALPYFREQGSGILINVSSVVSEAAQPYTSAYNLTKYAIRGLGESLREELLLDGARDIRVCTIMPASIDTPLFQHAANLTGRAVKPLEPIYPVEKVARAIVDVVDNPRPEIIVGNAGRQMIALKRILPLSLFERLMAWKVERDHLTREPSPQTTGNVFEPMPQYACTSGGWRSNNGGPSIGKWALVGLAVAAPALLYWAGQRNRVPALTGRRKSTLRQLLGQ